MTRFFLTCALTLTGLCALPMTAAAQPVTTPAVEFVIQGAAETGAPGGIGLTPRFTISLGPDTSLDLGGTFTPTGRNRFNTDSTGTVYEAALRQRLWTNRRWQVFGLLGASRANVVTLFPGYEYSTSIGRVTIPPSRVEFAEWAAQVAAAVQYELHPRLSLRADGRIIAGERGALGIAVGAVAPLGRGPQRRWDDEPDSVSEGLWIGAATGGGTGAVTFGLLAAAFCEHDGCVGGTLGAMAVGAATGAAMGGIIGAVIDGLMPGRRRK